MLELNITFCFVKIYIQNNKFAKIKQKCLVKIDIWNNKSVKIKQKSVNKKDENLQF